MLGSVHIAFKSFNGTQLLSFWRTHSASLNAYFNVCVCLCQWHVGLLNWVKTKILLKEENIISSVYEQNE